MKIPKTVYILAVLLGLALMQIPQEADLKSKTQSQKADRVEISKKVSSITLDSWVTAYSSTYDQTDSTPFVTASGQRVEEGIVAANFLPFGTKINMPRLFGDKVFIVKDRMHKRKIRTVDVWMPTEKEAKNFGRHYSKIKIVSTPNLESPLLRYY